MNFYKRLYEVMDKKQTANCQNIGWLQGTMKIVKATLEDNYYSPEEKLKRIESLIKEGLEGSETRWNEMQAIELKVAND